MALGFDRVKRRHMTSPILVRGLTAVFCSSVAGKVNHDETLEGLDRQFWLIPPESIAIRVLLSHASRSGKTRGELLRNT